MPAKALAVVALLLLAAALPLPYGYYTFLRLVVCGSSAFEAYTGLVTNKKNLWPWAAIGIALLFNPVIPVHLSKGIWACIDLSVAIIFAGLAYTRFRSNRAEDKPA